MCSTVRTVSTTTPLSTPVTGLTRSSVTSPVLSSGLLEVLEEGEEVEVLEVVEEVEVDQTRK